MTMTRRFLCVLAGGWILWPSTVLAQTPRFYPDDPLRREPPPIAVTDAQPRALSAMLETVTNTLGLPGERHPEDAVIPVGGVNTLGEVMDGPWFVNRHATTRLSPEELRRGPGDANPPDIARAWNVLVVKPYGVRPGILVTDARGELYLLRFDPPGSLGLATGAEMVASRAFYALGYHVGENYIVRFERKQLVPDETGQAVSSAGRTRPLIDADIDVFLGTVAQGPGGVLRAVATRLPRERDRLLGPYQVFGVRSDDPNDIVQHEHRRDLRGLFVFAAWLNHNNLRAVNTEDVLVDEEGIPHLRHHLMDFSAALGSSALGGPKRAWEGHELLYPGLKTVGKNVAGLGLYAPSWMRADFRGPSAVGHIDFATFDPERWTTNHPITPFLNRLPDDTFWAARQVMAFTDEDIRTLVATGEYGDPEAEAWIVRCLIERRNRIGRAYLVGVLPLHHFRIENGALAFDDLGTVYGFVPPRAYKAEWFTFDNKAGTLSAPLPADGFRLPAAAASAADGAYIAVRLTGAEPEKTVTVYVRKATERFEVVGIDRRWPGRKDAEPSRVSHRGPSRYPNLDPVQRALFDKYAEGYKARTGRTDSPRELFDRQSVSQQTTFDAVTHALMKSKLTAADGSDLGSALDLIDTIDRVAGQYAGGGSDQQFRIYVQLKDGTREVLEKSQQFFRDHENTVYHVGYPHSYRQTGKEPNIQFSLSADGKRADIDVDYRSSRAPRAMFNGHLTAANSDVRVGRNPRLHDGRWSGFVAWWQDVFGRVGDAPEQPRDLLGMDRPDAPPTPLPPDRPAGQTLERVEDAAQEFLTDWIVRRKYDEALELVSSQSYACLNLDDDAREEALGADRARTELRQLMEYATEELGTRQNLTDAIEAVQPANPSRTTVDQAFRREFTLTPASAADAQQYQCGQTTAPPASTEHYEVLFQFREEGAGPMGLLWTREGGSWRLVSYRLVVQ
jgi:hypothetical protein